MRSFLTPRNVLLIVVGVWVLASVPVWFFQTNPPIQNEPAWDSPQTRALAKRACFDCHSNETEWPIYSRIAPMSYFVTNHVIEGREHANFSEWGTAQGSRSAGDDVLVALGLEPDIAFANGDEDEGEEYEGEEGGEGGEGGEQGRENAEELVEVIVEGEMPLESYLFLHPEAQLSETEKQQLIEGFRATFR
jgi:hypothetical protein